MHGSMIGKLLLKDKVVTKEQLAEAIEIQKESGGLLGIILVNLGHINDEILVRYLGKQAAILSGEDLWEE